MHGRLTRVADAVNWSGANVNRCSSSGSSTLYSGWRAIAPSSSGRQRSSLMLRWTLPNVKVVV